MTNRRMGSYICKLIVIFSAAIGVFMSAYAGRHSFMGGRTVFMYFTTQSNIALAIICAAGLHRMLREKQSPRAAQLVKFVGTVSITLTGMVFCFVLAPTMGNAAWNIQNILTHVIVPVFSVIDFFIIGAEYSYRKRDAMWVVIPPIVYAIYAGIGYAQNWHFSEKLNYPYFFLNWGSEAGAFGFSKQLPFMGCGWWIIFLAVFLILVGLVYLIIIDVLGKRAR